MSYIDSSLLKYYIYEDFSLTMTLKLAISKVTDDTLATRRSKWFAMFVWLKTSSIYIITLSYALYLMPHRDYDKNCMFVSYTACVVI